MAQAKQIKELAGKLIKRASIEQAEDLLMLELALDDGTTFSMEVWPQRPKLKLNLLPVEDGASPVAIKV